MAELKEIAGYKALTRVHLERPELAFRTCTTLFGLAAISACGPPNLRNSSSKRGSLSRSRRYCPSRARLGRTCYSQEPEHLKRADRIEELGREVVVDEATNTSEAHGNRSRRAR
jgi:hypothetical protein